MTTVSAEVYTWRDLSGETHVSNVAPRWYQPDARVIGPRVVVTVGDTLIDDTALPLGKRLQQQRSAPRR
jgi:hypothetical protein